MHVYLYMAVYQSRSNEAVKRNEGSHTQIIFIAFLKLNAGTVIGYNASDIHNEKTSLSWIGKFFQMSTLKLKYSFLFNLKWRQKHSGHKFHGRTANGMSGKMKLFPVWQSFAASVSLHFALMAPLLSCHFHPFQK